MPDLKDMTVVITGKEKEGNLMEYEMDPKVKEQCVVLMDDMKALISKEGMDPKDVIMSMLEGNMSPEVAEEEMNEEEPGDKEMKKKMLIMALGKKGE